MRPSLVEDCRSQMDSGWTARCLGCLGLLFDRIEVLVVHSNHCAVLQASSSAFFARGRAFHLVVVVQLTLEAVPMLGAAAQVDLEFLIVAVTCRFLQSWH